MSGRCPPKSQSRGERLLGVFGYDPFPSAFSLFRHVPSDRQDLDKVSGGEKRDRDQLHLRRVGSMF